MLTLNGIPINIKKPLLGRVSFDPVNEENEENTIIINPKISSKGRLKNYLALICSESNMDNSLKTFNIPILYNVNNIDALSNSDVIEILPSGLINVLYQINSTHNQIFVTSRCNSNCIMCPQPIDPKEDNLTEFNLKLISLIDKSKEELAFNGGEPTLLDQDLFRLILACKTFLPNTSLLLLTNARRFSDFKYTHLYSSLQHPNLTVSTAIYGDNEDEHDFVVGSKGAFNETIVGILNLASFGNAIEIRTVINKYTYRNLLRISEYIYRNMTFVRHIAFMGLETVWRARKNLEQIWIDPEEFVSYLKESIHYLRQRGMNVSIYNIPLCCLPEPLWMFAKQSISEWKSYFASQCFKCAVKEQCSGIFKSGVDVLGRYLRPL